MDQLEHAPSDLMRALDAIERCQIRFLEDLQSTCKGDPCFLEAFRRWEETLTLLKLHIHRAEQRLLHFLLVPEERREWKGLPGPQKRHQRKASFSRWNKRVLPYFQSLHIDTRYMRLSSVLELDEDAVVADINTDLVALAEICENTGEALERFKDLDDQRYLEDLAFYHVLNPWKQQGMQALMDVLRWINEFLHHHSDL
ncbi:MAG: hypothetical protein HRU15_08985 [Planctomycetes bacterium]|nr:hypothetical protein [Planctomycetota bacterium]